MITKKQWKRFVYDVQDWKIECGYTNVLLNGHRIIEIRLDEDNMPKIYTKSEYTPYITYSFKSAIEQNATPKMLYNSVCIVNVNLYQFMRLKRNL